MNRQSADELEQADALQEQDRIDGLARVRAALVQTHPDFDGKHCVNPRCGEELPPVRIAYKRVRCTPCQDAEDKRLKMQGRRG